MFLHCIDGRAVSNIVAVIADELDGLGVDVTVIATEVRDAGWSSSVRTLDLGGRGRRTMWCIPALERALADVRPDVVIAHTNGPNRAAVIASSIMRRRSRPMVVAVEHVQYSTTEWSHPWLRRLANALVLPRADRLVGVSPGVVADLGTRFPHARSRLAMIPPPLTRWADIESLAAEPVGHEWFQDGVRPITTVGNINRYKDHRTLIRAVARLTDSAARLVVIGRPDEAGLLQDLRSLAADLGLRDRVAFLGYQANPLKYVARSSVFAMSSKSEGLGIALLEALACGVPTVSTACPGPAWLLEEGRCGLLAPVGDHAALGAALEQMLTDPPTRQRVIDAGSQRVRAFSPRRIAERYLSLTGLSK